MPKISRASGTKFVSGSRAEEISKTKGNPAPRKHLSTGRRIAIKAMLNNGMSEWQVAALEGVSRSTVHYINKDQDLDELKPHIVEATRKMLASRFYLLADKAITKAEREDKIENMNSYQLTMMSAVSVDKARLMDGLSTENLSVRGVLEQTHNEIEKINAMREHLSKRIYTKDDDNQSNPDPTIQ